MQKGCSNSRTIPKFELVSRAFIEGQSKIFRLIERQTRQIPDHSREWMRCAYADIALDKFVRMFPLERTHPLSLEEEQDIIWATRKRMREHEDAASSIIDDLMSWCMSMQQNQIKRTCGDFASDTDDF